MNQGIELLNAKATARYLGMSRTTLWRKCRDGDLPKPKKVAGLTRWRLSELTDFLDKIGASGTEDAR